MVKLKFDQIIEVNGNKLTKKYLESISIEEREKLIDPVFEIFRETGFLYPEGKNLKKSYQKIVDFQPDLSVDNIFNNSSCGTDICKYFCRSFYNATEKNKPTMIEIFNNDEKLKSIIRNRFGIAGWWFKTGLNFAFNISPRMIVQGMRSMRLINATTMFKPTVAKYICMKYSEHGDLVGDYSCGYGGRMLGAISCGRKYIGTDPLTVPELQKMADYFEFKDYILIKSGSEDYCGDKNSLNLIYSSPPYFDQEYYSNDITQAYNKGEDYFYNIYWKKTLENAKYMLKYGGWFGLNVANYPKMLEMTNDLFGEPDEIIKLRTVRSHLTKPSAGITKFEPVYMYKKK